MSNSPVIGSFALIIGEMKSGTTSLFRYLAQHPQIAASSIKEPEFFVDERRVRDERNAYYALWDWDPARHRWALEGSVAYTNPVRRASIARRIADFGAEFRFLYVVRSPIERIESHYNHAFSAGWMLREVGIDELIDKRPLFVDRTKYAQQLDPYVDLFGRDKILVVNASSLKASPTAEMERICRFLEVDPHQFEDLARVHNPGQGRIVEHPAIAWTRGHQRLFDGLRRYVPRAVQRGVRSALGGRLTEPFRMSSAARRRVLDLLRDDLERLSTEWGVDTSAWGLESDAAAEALPARGGSRGPA